MTKTDMLERKIKDSGLSISELAAMVGIGEDTLARKLCGAEEFLVSEIWNISCALNLEPFEVQEIFLRLL